jgi:Holliday junction resolvase RusA-like endonuclease
MEKIEKEYQETYGGIPRDFDSRLHYLISHLNIKKDRDQIFPSMKRINNIKWNDVSFCIYLVPKATPRLRGNMKTHIFYVKGAAVNRNIFRRFISTIDQPMIYRPCKFYCTTYFPIPSSMNKVEQLLSEMGFIRPISKPDWDNIGKTYSDMVQEQLLYDDSLIIEGVSRKYYSCKPRIEITIKYMEEFDSKFNENKIMNKIER